MPGPDDRRSPIRPARQRRPYEPPRLVGLGHLADVAQKSGNPNDQQHPTLGKPGGGGG